MKLSTLLISAMVLFAVRLFAHLLPSDLKFSRDLTQARTATCLPTSPCLAELSSLSWNLPRSLTA